MGRFSPTVVPTGTSAFGAALRAGVPAFLAARQQARDDRRDDAREARAAAAEDRERQLFAVQMQQAAHDQQQQGLRDAVARAQATSVGVDAVQHADGTITATSDATRTPGAVAAAERARVAAQQTFDNDLATKTLAQRGEIAVRSDATERYTAQLRASLERQLAGQRSADERYEVDHRYPNADADAGATPGAGAALPPKQLRTVQQLRTAYGNEPAVKSAASVAEGYAKMRQAADGTPSPQGDMSLIYGFMKMQDPGSTVREGEYASAKNTTGVSGAVLNAYNQALAGELLNPEQRRRFLGQAEGIARAHQDLVRGAATRHTAYATQAGADPSHVVYDPLGAVLPPRSYALPNGGGSAARGPAPGADLDAEIARYLAPGRP